MATNKTVEITRLNAKTELFCSVLASSKYEEPTDVVTALTKINSINSGNFHRNSLKPLNEINLILPSGAESIVVKSFLSKEENKRGKFTLETLFPVREAIKDTNHLLGAFETISSSTATSECSFSALSKINSYAFFYMRAFLFDSSMSSIFIIYA